MKNAIAFCSSGDEHSQWRSEKHYAKQGDLGLIARKNENLLKSKIYQGFGLGFRFRNENLTFNTFQLRLAYYPNVYNTAQLGFRIATYGFVDLGLIARKNENLLQSKIYQGFGFRFRNENLTFNTFQLRLAYYPNVYNTAQLGFEVGGETPLRFRDFTIEQPEIVPFR